MVGTPWTARARLESRLSLGGPLTNLTHLEELRLTAPRKVPAAYLRKHRKVRPNRTLAPGGVSCEAQVSEVLDGKTRGSNELGQTPSRDREHVVDDCLWRGYLPEAVVPGKLSQLEHVENSFRISTELRLRSRSSVPTPVGPACRHEDTLPAVCPERRTGAGIRPQRPRQSEDGRARVAASRHAGLTQRGMSVSVSTASCCSPPVPRHPGWSSAWRRGLVGVVTLSADPSGHAAQA